MDRELRRLVLVSVGLLVALFTGRAVIGALWDEEATTRSALALRAKLRAGGEADSRPAREVLTAASELRDALAAELERLQPAVRYVQPPEFSVPSGASPDLTYIEIVRREQERLVREAAYKGRSVPPQLGLPDLNPTGLEDVLRTLRSLHIVHLVVNAALDGGIDSVERITMPPPARGRRAETGYVRLHKVEFDLRGAPRAVRDTLAAVAAGAPYLALDELRLEALDEEGGAVRARFSAAAVTLDATDAGEEGAAP